MQPEDDETTQPVEIPAPAPYAGTAEHTRPLGVGPTGPAAGWYADPWDGRQHRYWSGSHWTAETFPNGPATALPAPGAVPAWSSPAAGREQEAPPSPPYVGQAPPPAWAPPAQPTDGPGWAPTPTPTPPHARSRLRPVAALCVGLLAGFALAYTVGTLVHHRRHRKDSPAIAAPAPPTTAARPADPSASLLDGLVVRRSDVGPGASVATIPGGASLDDATLDLCGATFPSEALRRARLQVLESDSSNTAVLSTEAVLYNGPAATAQGFAELRSAASSCPPGPVPSPSGDSSTTHFNPPPDGAWPQTAGVERVAFDFTTTDALGQAHHDVAVYLRRGRVLEGLYFPKPDEAQPPVAGQTTVATIVTLFAQRLAQLPASAIGP